MTDARLLATNPEDSSLVPVACNASGRLLVTDVNIEEIPNDVTLDGDLTVTGTGTFAGKIESNYTSGNMFEADSTWGFSNCAFRSRFGGSGDNARYHFYATSASTEYVEIKTDGSCAFASGKAGFTAEGNLFCTTQRGRLVILDSTSNGLGTWADYEPSRRSQVAEKLEEWSEKDKPSET